MSFFQFPKAPYGARPGYGPIGMDVRKPELLAMVGGTQLSQPGAPGDDVPSLFNTAVKPLPPPFQNDVPGLYNTDVKPLPAAEAPAASPEAALPTGTLPASVYGAYESNIRRYLNDPEYRSLAEQLRASMEGRKGTAGQGVDLAKEQAEMFNAMPQQLDLSSMAALVDQWSGSNLAKAYNRPISPMERMQAAWELQNAIQKAESGMTEQEMKDLERQLTEADRKRRLGIDTELALLGKKERQQEKSAADAREETAMRADKKMYHTQYGEMIEGLGPVTAKVNKLADIIQRNGGIPQTGPEAAEFISLQSDVLTGLNKFDAKLGALAGGDVDILRQRMQIGGNALENFMLEKMKGAGGIQAMLRNIGKEIDSKIEGLDPIVAEATPRAVELHKRTLEYYKNLRGGKAAPTTEDPRIEQFMKDNGITDKQQAIGILKREGIIK